jgi:threonyl-tRNA synthetase
MTLNDGHVFCAPGDVRAEVAAILGLVEKAYQALAIPAPSYRLSLRGPGSKYVGDPAVWAKSEAVLRSALGDLGVAYSEAEGEAAFYGPKIDLQVTDPRGREETLSTVQVDFHLPERFALSYQDGPVSARPVMIHRSIVSTMERMVAHLLEVHDGALPVWLAPSQVVIMPVVTDAVDHARRLHEALQAEAIRVELDDRDATLGSRVRDAEQRRVPYLAVVGRREVEDDTVAVRLRGGAQLGTLSTEAFVALVSDVAGRRLPALAP